MGEKNKTFSLCSQKTLSVTDCECVTTRPVLWPLQTLPFTADRVVQQCVATCQATEAEEKLRCLLLYTYCDEIVEILNVVFLFFSVQNDTLVKVVISLLRFPYDILSWNIKNVTEKSLYTYIQCWRKFGFLPSHRSLVRLPTKLDFGLNTKEGAVMVFALASLVFHNCKGKFTCR